MTELSFDTVNLRQLEEMSSEDRNALPFGIIGIGTDGTAQTYNATEARLSGLDPATVIGVPYFETIAQCMNNFMVAQRFEDEPDIDDIVPYILTLRMRPTKVRLRLLATAGMPRRYILIER